MLYTQVNNNTYSKLVKATYRTTAAGFSPLRQSFYGGMVGTLITPSGVSSSLIYIIQYIKLFVKMQGKN